MAKTMFAIYLIVLSIGSTAAYAEECAIGSEYWCKSFENAKACGALRHCTDTVWSHDDKYTTIDRSTTCQWCKKILGNIHAGLGDYETLTVPAFTSGCKVLPSDEFASKCENVIKNYETSVVALMKNKRFATLCHLMNICTDEKAPVVLGSKRCTWGPSYWCSSLSNSHECGSIDHCANQIWSQQAIQKKENDNICRYCENTIDKLRSIVEENRIAASEIDAKKWLTDTCPMLQSKSAIDECVQTMSQYSEEILVLLDNHVDSGIICHLGDMCKEATIIPREKVTEDQSKMLCNVIVRATYDLHVNQQQNSEQIESFLKNDCQQLSTSDLRQKCGELVKQHGSDIYTHVVDNMELSKVCEALTHPSSSSVSAECTLNSDNHCQCCKDNLFLRQTNFRETINEILKNLLSFCNDDKCRSNLQSKYQEILNRIDLMDFTTLCQRIGFCSTEDSQLQIPFISDLADTINLDLNSNIQDLSENICGDFGELKPICEHLIISTTNVGHRNIYMAILKNNPSLIDENLRPTSANTCEECKNFVHAGRTYSIETLDLIHNTLLQACDYCSSKDQCKNSLNEGFNNLVSYLKQMDPDQFCRNLHLCTVATTSTCETCIQRFDQRKDDVLQAIDRLAGYFTDLCQKHSDKQCQVYVKEVKDSIIKSIGDFNSKDICNSIGFCSANVELNFDDYEKYFTNEIETNICSTLGPFEVLCKNVIHGNTEHIQSLKMNYDIEDIMKIGEELTDDSNETDKCKCCIARVKRRKQHIKFTGDLFYDAAIHSCDKCPTKRECRIFWRAAKAQFDERIQKICPYQVCVHFGFCNKTTEQPKPIDQSNSTCILCEYAMNILSNYIHQQSTEKEIEENLQKICKEIPSVLQDECREYIDNYTPTIISILLTDFNLSTVCQRLNLCLDQMKFDIQHLVKADLTTCSICDYVSAYVKFAQPRYTMEKALANVCTYVSGEQNLKCQIIVQLFAPHMEQLQLGPSDNFCKELTICQTPMIDLNPGIVIEPEKPTITPKCTICQYIISYLDAVLKNNKSEQAVEAALEKVCTILPEKARSECTDLIKTYGPVIAQLIAESADPNTICQHIGVCQKSAAVFVQTTYTCTICQYVLSRMKYFTGLKQTENEVLTSLKQSCDLFSVDTLKTQCQDFLAQHGSSFLLITSDVTEPKFACQGIDICRYKQSATTESVTPVPKYGKCAIGAKYWCLSHENAEQCNAVDYCQRNVWSVLT